MKCDAEQPSCRNCQKRSIQCVTTDLRRPERSGQRTEPKGRRANRTTTPILSSIPHPKTDEDYNPLTIQLGTRSTTPPPSPTSHLLAQIEHDRAIPSIFTTPFQNGDQHTRRSRRTAHSSLDSTTKVPPVSPTNVRGDMTSEPGLSPQNSGLLVVTDKSRSRLQIVGSGSSVYVMAHWLDLFFAKRDYWRPIYPFFQQGLAYSIEVPLPFLNSLPSLPPPSKAAEYFSSFFSQLYPIYPIIDLLSLEQSIGLLGPKLDQQQQRLAPTDYPALACLYAVFSIAADELKGRPTSSGAIYLEGAYSLYAHLVALPYVASVQALLLLAIVLRHRNKDGASLGTLGQAIRIAQSIGLHQYMPTTSVIGSNSGGSTVDVSGVTDLHSRIWWTAYILERAMELETGRPSAIRDSECDQIRPAPVMTQQRHIPSFDYFGSLIQLAQIQTQIIELFYTSKQRRETKELLHEMGRLDRALLEWAARFPEEIR
ncbi:uncharacterized protein A1O9_02314 [Exophiala aquamarina CBS 119918]|uniref:Xylanolytic transcriptional activator regulatory domain-containing protein n=1 Tax=Exophiala aquamarina CBS 119918 TaxID=1182545 RepID=A0A072PN48_9EURO|nr:uncharacterized protein A1O9_02314 [Exophiala aquamarina CBS 119918]KEF60753.1 hypothetical protein A1O9_02314 [Exophiala aquamarina CBS 119918]